MTITPEQHQIERMSIWKQAYDSAIKAGRGGENAAASATAALAAFDACFPAPQAPPAPVEGDWIPHTPGDPMPVSRGTMVDIKMRGGATLYGVLMKPTAWDRDRAASHAEIISWRPAK